MDSYTLEFSVCSKVITFKKCIHYKPLREKKLILINSFASTYFYSEWLFKYSIILF